ncbi:hypothetical protein V8E54_012482 [Elaphomyces granulatus]|jgi:hypothetical protein
MSESGASLSVESFYGLIKRAVEQQQRTYLNAAAISIRWEADKTHADEDTRAFQNFMQLLGFPPAEEIV